MKTAGLSRELRAVLTIIGASADLERKAASHINIGQREINWDGIYGSDLTSGELAAVCWAHAIWCGQIWATAQHLSVPDPFDRASSMDRRLRAAVVRALEIWLGVE